MQLTQAQLNALLEKEVERKSKLRNNLHESENLLVDLLMDSNGSRQPPRYIKNIQWFLENLPHYSDTYFLDSLNKSLDKHIKEKTNFSVKEVNSFPLSFKKELFDNKNINKRIENLLNNHKIQNWDIVKNKIIRVGNNEIVLCLNGFGFQPLSLKNFLDDCIMGYNHSLVNEIISNPLYGWKQCSNEQKTDNLFCMIKSKSWKNIKQIMELEPNLFTNSDKDGNNFFFHISKVNYHKTLFNKEIIDKNYLVPIPNYMKNIIKSVFFLYEKENKPIEITGLCHDFQELYNIYLYESLNKSTDNNFNKIVKKMKL